MLTDCSIEYLLLNIALVACPQYRTSFIYEHKTQAVNAYHDVEQFSLKKKIPIMKDDINLNDVAAGIYSFLVMRVEDVKEEWNSANL